MCWLWARGLSAGCYDGNVNSIALLSVSKPADRAAPERRKSHSGEVTIPHTILFKCSIACMEGNVNHKFPIFSASDSALFGFPSPQSQCFGLCGGGYSLNLLSHLRLDPKPSTSTAIITIETVIVYRCTPPPPAVEPAGREVTLFSFERYALSMFKTFPYARPFRLHIAFYNQNIPLAQSVKESISRIKCGRM